MMLPPPPTVFKLGSSHHIPKQVKDDYLLIYFNNELLCQTLRHKIQPPVYTFQSKLLVNSQMSPLIKKK